MAHAPQDNPLITCVLLFRNDCKFVTLEEKKSNFCTSSYFLHVFNVSQSKYLFDNSKDNNDNNQLSFTSLFLKIITTHCGCKSIFSFQKKKKRDKDHFKVCFVQ